MSFNAGAKMATLYFPDGTTTGAQNSALAIVADHDPVVLQTKRSGSAVNVYITKPRNLDSATAVMLTVDTEAVGIYSPINSSARLWCSDQITVGVSAYPCESVSV